jgi:hypothetical protein
MVMHKDNDKTPVTLETIMAEIKKIKKKIKKLKHSVNGMKK